MTTRTLRDGETTTEDRRLDRIVLFDDRSRDFPVRALLAETPVPGQYDLTYLTAPPRSYTWDCDIVLDQGREGACVGFAWTHEAAARPDRRFATQSDALALYRRAKQLDPWPGEAYDGTAVLAGAKAAVEKGWLQSYRWAFRLEDIVRTLGFLGPVILGIAWHQGDYQVDAANYITGAGPVVGGHAILALGVKIVWKEGATGRTFADIDLDRSYVILHNSWGPRFGRRGRCLMSLTELARRMGAQGECCVPVMRGAASQPRMV